MVAAPGLRETALPAIDVGDSGRLALVYMGSFNSPGPPFDTGSPPIDYSKVEWNGFLAQVVDARVDDPVIYSAAVNEPADPLVKGTCGMIRCQQEFDFLDVVIGPDGTPWAALVDGVTPDGKAPGAFGKGIVARLVGGPPLRDEPPVPLPDAGARPPAPATGHAPAAACNARAEVRRFAAMPRGRRVHFAVDLETPTPLGATVDIFAQSEGRRILGERLVARFAGVRSALTWRGQANRPRRRVQDGIYVARIRAPSPDGGTDVRRLVLERRRGRFTVRRDYDRHDNCGVLPFAKLKRPVFGGRPRNPLSVAFRTLRDANVRVVIRHRGRIVRILRGARRAGVMHRLRFLTRGRARGDYSVRIAATIGARTATATLVSRRL